MKIICAGYPKTGTKSCSSALRILGFNVADYAETMEFLSLVWAGYLDGKVSIDKVLAEYEKHGFDANQDVPGTLLWEDLYRALPKVMGFNRQSLKNFRKREKSKQKGTKVILTVRESDERWFKSWRGFWDQEFSRRSVGDLNFTGIFQKCAERGWMTREMQAVSRMSFSMIRTYIDPTFNDHMYSHKNAMRAIDQSEKHVRVNYLKHNMWVKSIVPKEDLLVWDVKEGWAPLCNFLKLPEPDCPIPHDNKTGDYSFMEKYIRQSEPVKNSQKVFAKNLLIAFAEMTLIGYVGYKQWASGGTWASEKLKLISVLSKQILKVKL